eukprot:364810-Chlamydomonas_euryale.AAC.10
MHASYAMHAPCMHPACSTLQGAAWPQPVMPPPHSPAPRRDRRACTLSMFRLVRPTYRFLTRPSRYGSFRSDAIWIAAGRDPSGTGQMRSTSQPAARMRSQIRVESASWKRYTWMPLSVESGRDL